MKHFVLPVVYNFSQHTLKGKLQRCVLLRKYWSKHRGFAYNTIFTRRCKISALLYNTWYLSSIQYRTPNKKQESWSRRDFFGENGCVSHTNISTATLQFLIFQKISASLSYCSLSYLYEVPCTVALTSKYNIICDEQREHHFWSKEINKQLVAVDVCGNDHSLPPNVLFLIFLWSQPIVTRRCVYISIIGTYL